MKRLLEWLTLGETIREDQLEIASKPDRRKALEQLAMTTAEAGDRALRPVSPFRSGSGELASIVLHRECIVATLAALGKDLGGLADDEALRTRVTHALPESVSFERICELIAGRHDDAVEKRLRVEPGEAAALGTTARVLLNGVRAPERRLQDAFARRFFRVGLLVAIVVLALIGAATAGSRLMAGPNLAEGKPWRASSTYARFSPDTGMVRGEPTEIFFHTNREDEPWVELDLGEPTLIRRVDVRNSQYWDPDQAFPLAIEGSLDGQAWRELGRKTRPFSRWRLEFEPTRVRYVRAKALKRTALHLESLEVR